MLKAKDGKIVTPDGKPLNLTGWRVDIQTSVRKGPVSPEEIARYKAEGTLGNAQGIEIWWSRPDRNPGEGLTRPGEYNAEPMAVLLETMRNFARAGCWIIPSIRVSYDSEACKAAEADGTVSWQGWAEHLKTINNAPVVVQGGPKKGQYGRYRDRFFKWLDWLIPQILADAEIAARIGYWEMWHYPGHKHGIGKEGWDAYLDDFMPRLIAHFRKHEPTRLLGVGMLPDPLVNQTIARIKAGSWAPYPDANLCYVVAGYGVLSAIMRPEFNTHRSFAFPKDSQNPSWRDGEFNIETLARLSGVTLASQEGPGLRQNFRTTPIPEQARTWFKGILELYTRVANGWGIHAWPPSWADAHVADDTWVKPDNFDESDFNSIVKACITPPAEPAGDVPQPKPSTLNARIRAQAARLADLIAKLPE